MKNYWIYTVLIAFCAVVTSCVDRDFDTPPLNGEDPSIDESQIVTIEELLNLYEPGKFIELEMDKYLRVLVVADDRSGNFFRSLVVEDETGGLTVLLDDVELWNRFFVGKRLYIHLSELWLSDFNGLPQIGYTPFDDDGFMSLGRIPSALINDVIISGSFNHEVSPELVTIDQLSFEVLNTLIRLENVQFVSSDLGETFADANNLQARNQVIEDCSGNRVILRTSGFADFASIEVPEGNGNLTAIYSTFGSDKQLLLRTIDDIEFDGLRCNPNAVSIDDEDIITIAELLQSLNPGNEVLLPDMYLKGRVVSNDAAGNFFKSLVIEDETAGIALLVDAFDLFETYPPGTEVYVMLRELCLSEYNGLPQLCFAPSSSNVKRIPESQVPSVIIPTGIIDPVEPEEKDIASLSLLDLNTLVTFDNVQFTPGSASQPYADAANQFSVNHIVEDCDGNEIIVRTSGFADFADERTPAGNGSLTGVLQIFSGSYQVFLRDETDVSMNDARCGETVEEGPFSEGFEALADFDPVFLPGWTNVALKGNRLWIKRSFDGNGFAEAEAYQDPDPETDTWLITPEINTAETPTLRFESAMAFYQHDGATVYVAGDYTGDVSAANWQVLPARLATEADGNFNWVDSGTLDLSVYGSTVHVAFRYEGTAAGNTTKFRIDNVTVE